MLAEPELDVFDCPTCGGHVRLVDAARTRCPACDAEIDVPHPVREVQEVAGAHAALDREAQAVAERIGHAPHPALRMLTLFESSCAFVVLLPVVAILATGVSAVLLRSLAPRIGVAADDDRYTTFGAFLVTSIFWGGGLVIATYAGRRLAGLRELQASLAAKPPERSGGSSSCRNCGAPLAVPADALAVRCRHCSAENLVAIEPGWLARARHAKEKRGESLVAAARTWDAEVARLRRSARSRALGVLLVAGPLLAFVGAIVLGSPPTVRETPFEKESRTPRLMVDRDYVKADFENFSPLLSPASCEEPQKPRRFRFPPIGCDADGCTVPWYVALTAGARVRLSTREEGDALVLFYPAGEPPFSKASRGELLVKAKPKPGADAELTAPRDGFYLVLYHLRGATPDRHYDLCAQLAR